MDDIRYANAAQPRQVPPRRWIYGAHRHEDGPPRLQTPHLMFTLVDGVAILVASQDSARSMNLRERTSYNPIQEHTILLDEGARERTSGWSEEAILKLLKTRTTQEISQEAEICTICQDEYEVHEKIGSLSCGHEFHRDCIKDWLLVNNTCPVCRRPALEKSRTEKQRM